MSENQEETLQYMYIDSIVMTTPLVYIDNIVLFIFVGVIRHDTCHVLMNFVFICNECPTSSTVKCYEKHQDVKHVCGIRIRQIFVKNVADK